MLYKNLFKMGATSSSLKDNGNEPVVIVNPKNDEDLKALYSDMRGGYRRSLRQSQLRQRHRSQFGGGPVKMTTSVVEGELQDIEKFQQMSKSLIPEEIIGNQTEVLQIKPVEQILTSRSLTSTLEQEVKDLRSNLTDLENICNSIPQSNEGMDVAQAATLGPKFGALTKKTVSVFGPSKFQDFGIWTVDRWNAETDVMDKLNHAKEVCQKVRNAIQTLIDDKEKKITGNQKVTGDEEMEASSTGEIIIPIPPMSQGPPVKDAEEYVDNFLKNNNLGEIYREIAKQISDNKDKSNSNLRTVDLTGKPKIEEVFQKLLQENHPDINLKRDQFLALLCEKDLSENARNLICNPTDKVTQYFWARMMTVASKPKLGDKLIDGVDISGTIDITANYVGRALQARCGRVFANQSVFENQPKVLLNNCQIVSLPHGGLGKFPNAQLVDLSSNFIGKLPSNIGDLPQMVVLNLSNNKLTRLEPHNIVNLNSYKKLRVLNLTHNFIPFREARAYAVQLVKNNPELKVYFTGEENKTKVRMGNNVKAEFNQSTTKTPTTPTTTISQTTPKPNFGIGLLNALQAGGGGSKSSKESSRVQAKSFYTNSSDDGYFEY